MGWDGEKVFVGEGRGGGSSWILGFGFWFVCKTRFGERQSNILVLPLHSP